MIRALVLLSLALPSSAMAKNPNWYAAGASSVELEGQVDVPLYRGYATGGTPVVEISGATPDEEGKSAPRRLATFSLFGVSVMGDGTVEDFGAKAKEDGDGNKFAIIPEIHVGGVTLRNLRVAVIEADDQTLTSNFAHIALPTLEEVGSAYLPSEGVLRFVPADQADALVASVSEPIGFSWPLSGKAHEHGQKYTSFRYGVLVDGKVDDTEGLLMLLPSGISMVDPAYAPAVNHVFSGLRFTETTLSVGGARFDNEPALVAQMGWSGDDAKPLLGALGHTELLSSDIAVAPESKTVGLKTGVEPKWQDVSELYLELAKVEFDESAPKADEEKDEEAEEGESEGPDEGDRDEGARQTKYGKALAGAGHYKLALEHFRAAADVAGERCDPYRRYGRMLLLTGDLDGAATQFEKSATLYDKWASQDLETRLAIGRDEAPEGAYTLEQDSSCSYGWSDVADIRLVQGKTDEVERLFREHMDLDQFLAMVYGNSLLQQGKWTEADGAYRRALNLGTQRGYYTRVGIGVANAKAGNMEIFDKQVERLMSSDSEVGDLGGVLLVAFADELKGDGAGVELAKRLSEHGPWRRDNWLVLASALPEGAERNAALAKADELLKRDERAAANVEWVQASRAWWTALGGDIAGAEKIMTDMGERDNDVAEYMFFVQSELARLKGDDAARKAAIDRMRAMRGGLPLPASWLE